MNYSKQIFEMLDIEPCEEFKIDDFNTPYKLTEKLELKHFIPYNGKWHTSTMISIESILNGACKIKKIVKPTKEEQLAIDYAKACGCKWLAKDKDGCIYAYSTKPIRDNDAWIINDIFTTHEWIDIKIPISFIHWTDEEPYYIGD